MPSQKLDFRFMAGDGEMAGRIRAYDWSNSPLGPPAAWSQSLKSALLICLNTPIVAAVHWGPDLRILYNDIYAPALAERHPWALGQPFNQVWAEIWDVLGPHVAGVLGTGIGFSTERQLLKMKRNGRQEDTWWVYSFAPLYDDDGTVNGIFVTALDESDKVLASQKATDDGQNLRQLNIALEAEVLERTLERNRLWDNAQDLLLIARYDSTIISINPAWTEVLGWADEELAGTSFMDLLHPDDVAAAVQEVGRLGGEGRSTMKFENRYRSKAGAWIWLSWAVTSREGLFHAVARDITLEKESAAKLLVAQDTLRQSQKMEAVGQLTGGIAHDFNNMLAVVMGSLELLDRRIGPEDPRSKRYIQAATEGAKRAANLTQRLLAFSRQQPLQPETLDINRLVSGMSDLLRHSIGADTRLETVLAGGLWKTHVDPNQLENVVLNLSVNSRDAMPDGGRLTIETQNAHLDNRYVFAEIGVPAGQYVLLAISDTGTGMSTDVIAKAFDPFFTTKEIGKGTGLGLSQVYGFVKQSGGHIKIYSEVGNGTTIKIYLPRSEEEDIFDQDDFIPAGGLGGEALEIILVVDDEPAARQFSVDAFEVLGYGVLQAAGAAAALEIIEAHPEIALLFTDIVMPDTNGRMLADRAKLIRPALKILYTTGYTRNAVVHNGVVDKDVELIGKPFTIDELAKKVRGILES